MTNITFTVPNAYDGVMLKVFLRRACAVSARLLTVLKQTPGGLTRSGTPIRAIDTVKVGDCITLAFMQESNEVEAVPMPLSILYEDAHLLIVDKPPFMPVHPTSCGHMRDTLANAVSAYMQQKGEAYKIRPLNRLDKDTSGVVVLAKNAFCAHVLAQKMHKTYTAVVQGTVKGSGTISLPIRLKAGHTIQRETALQGQSAVTHYKAIESKREHTLLQLCLETGRTHQIRVHMSAMGYPLSGDDMYGGGLRFINRQALHCTLVSFSHPVTGTACRIEAPVPKDMQFIDFADFIKPTENV